MIVEWYPPDLVVDPAMTHLCKKPFYGHPHGCPNYGKKQGCPPKAELLSDMFDFDLRTWLIITTFPVGEFAERMRLAHPEWVGQPRQWYNPRRWQGSARKRHEDEIKEFLAQWPETIVSRSPEAQGLNVTATLKRYGLELGWTWPPEHSLENIVYQVSLCGHRRERHTPSYFRSS